MNRTKIVCTIGPSSRSPQMLRQIIEGGMDVARLNMSHADHAYHAETIRLIREAGEAAGKMVAIMGDLQGPKLRIGVMGKQGVTIEDGERVVLTTDKITGQRSGGKINARIPIQYQDLPKDIKPGERILIDDGLVELKVLGISGVEIFCEVVTGGVLTDHKGLNLPSTAVNLPSMTEKDYADLDFCLDQGVDWIALSFVRSANDVIQVKNTLIARCKPENLIRVIAKIEKPQGLEVIHEIIDAADAIMVARGDLGIEIPPENVPLVQKRIIHMCNTAGKPVITATQMLDSMIRNPRPTRAEASDVANAILDGTDALMLSGETASGKYPLEAVSTMSRIAAEVERATQIGVWQSPAQVKITPGNVTDAVSHATCTTAYDLRAVAIISHTSSGQTARAVAKYRPLAPILAITTYPTVARQLRLSWGVMPVVGEQKNTTEETIQDMVDLAAQHGFANNGDRVVLTAGFAINMPGTTNTMRVEVIKSHKTPRSG